MTGLKPPLPSGPESSYLLALNAAEGMLQLVIAREEPEGAPLLLCAEAWNAPSQGAERLAPALADAFARLKIAPAAVRGVAAVRGPGSFTGLRLALATASGLAHATGCLQAGLDYLALLASSALALLPPVPLRLTGADGPLRMVDSCGATPCSPPADQDQSGVASTNVTASVRLAQDFGAGTGVAYDPAHLWVLTHARRDLVHLQGFAAGDDGSDPAAVRPLCPIQVLSLADAVRSILTQEAECSDPRPFFLLGSGLSRNRAYLAAALCDSEHTGAGGETFRGHATRDLRTTASRAVLLSAAYDHPTAEALLRAAATARYRREDPVPLYVREADAVDNLPRIAQTLGLDPAEALVGLAELSSHTPDPGSPRSS